MDAAGEATFDVNSDDGFQLWIGGSLVSEAPRPRLAEWNTARVRFAEPGLYPLRLRYYQWMGGAGLTLTSSLPGEGAPLGPQGRRVLSQQLLYPEAPGNRPPQLNLRPVTTAPAQGPLGSQMLLDASASVDPDGHPVHLVWFMDGRRLGEGPQVWALVPPGAHRLRVETWDGGAPVQLNQTVIVAPLAKEVSFAHLAGKPRPHARGVPLPLPFRLAAQNGQALAVEGLRCEVTLRRVAGAGTDLVGRRGRPMTYSAASGRWSYALQTRDLPSGTYRVEARVLDAAGSTLAQLLGGFALR